MIQSRCQTTRAQTWPFLLQGKVTPLLLLDVQQLVAAD